MINRTGGQNDETSQTSMLDHLTYLITSRDSSDVLEMCLTDQQIQLGVNCANKPKLENDRVGKVTSSMAARRGNNRNNNAGDGGGTSSDKPSNDEESKKGDAGMAKKTVTFADYKGLALAVTIEVGDGSEINMRFSDTTVDWSDDDQASGSEPPLSLDFKQPASDYLHFRDRLERNFVSLENVILKDYTVLGTIKAKNIGYEKSVFVRLTYDSWESFINASACLAANVSQPSTHAAVYETFTFDIDIPSNINIKKAIEFAVCYSANGTQYWDNNDGANYRIVTSKWVLRQEELKGMDSVSEVRDCESWTGFACWENVDTSMPYW